MDKIRLDVLIAKNHILRSRRVAADLIKNGKVRVGKKTVLKPSHKISADADIEILSKPKYASRGGIKLEKALSSFNVKVNGITAIDVGSSTGGFTDCLIQSGAKRVYSIDAGKNQFNHKLKENPRVILYEKTNIKNLKSLPESADLAVIDLSFISLTKIIQNVIKLLKPRAKIIALIKPQFEVEREERNKNGVVKNKKSIERVIKNIKEFMNKKNLKTKGLIESPIRGKKGNLEYFIYLEK